jgi:DNA-directed RNA polymerase subunit RPC12/RpoP
MSSPAAPPPPPLPPSEEPAEPVFDAEPRRTPDTVAGTTADAGRTEDEGKGRVFPCPRCGADLVFNIGQQALKCPYCGYEEAIALPADQEVKERDFEEMLRNLAEHHDKGRNSYEGMKELRCGSCGGIVIFQGTLTSTRCPYCASPIQIDKAEQAKDRIAVDGVLPFHVDHDKAAHNLADWVKGRWFAPNDFLEQGVRADFNGVYLPYWTFDAMTFTRYTGQRGEHYTVTVGSGKDQRTETRTRWWPASGSFQRFFDDVLVNATRGLNEKLVQELEPWPLEKCDPYNQQMLAGFLARTYEVELPQAFEKARKRIRAALEGDVRARIGGDEQRIDGMDVRHTAVTFKHLLLPVWMTAYRYHGQPYNVYVNATTGEVQGERPYSWIKITLAVVLGLIAAGIAYLILAASQR